ncbi:MAG: ABC transporter substrate-binding protein, partial [Acidimicrobiales bacterium]
LDQLTFLTVANEISSYAALGKNGQDVLSSYTDVRTIASATKRFNVFDTPQTTPMTIQFNLLSRPLNRLAARQALIYATNIAALNKGIFEGQAIMTQSPTGPAGLFYEPVVPGTLTYNLAKARKIVHQLHGLSVTLPSFGGTEIAEVLQAQWAKAGIRTNLFSKGFPQAFLTSCGSFDPATGLTGLGSCFGNTGLFKFPDPHMVDMVNAAAQATDPTTRAADYQAIFSYISANAYAEFLGLAPDYLITVRQVRFPVDEPGVLAPLNASYWENVSIRG